MHLTNYAWGNSKPHKVIGAASMFSLFHLRPLDTIQRAFVAAHHPEIEEEEQLAAFRRVSDSLLAAFILYIISIIASFVTITACICWAASRHGKRSVMAIWGWATVAWTCLVGASIITTVLAHQIHEGEDAEVGSGFMAMTWSAFALMLIVSFIGFVVYRAKKKDVKVDK